MAIISRSVLVFAAALSLLHVHSTRAFFISPFAGDVLSSPSTRQWQPKPLVVGPSNDAASFSKAKEARALIVKRLVRLSKIVKQIGSIQKQIGSIQQNELMKQKESRGSSNHHGWKPILLTKEEEELLL